MVERGGYADASEVVREALRPLEERDRREHLHAALAVGIEQIEHGEGRPYTPELRAEIYRAVRRKAQEGRTQNADVLP